MYFFDLTYLIYVSPAILLGMWASYRVRSTFARASQVRAGTTGVQAARQILDSAGLHQVAIEPIQGHLGDHYDPRHKVLRLSPQVYASDSMAAVGVAAHEAGHAIQDAKRYLPLVLRNAAVPMANFGSSVSWVLIMLGFFLSKYLIFAGIIAFSFVVIFQIVNLPVEFDASRRAKLELGNLGIVHHAQQQEVNRVLNAAAMTYVAATLQSVMTLLYFVIRFAGRR